MRILYLYIESFRCFRPEHPIELNFTNDYRFKLEKGAYGCQLGCVEAESKLPSNFFSMSNGESAVMEISAIVGKNGSGKTSLASFFQRFRMINARENKFIIVYEQTLNKSWRCISSLKDIVMPTNGSDTPKAGFVWKLML